MLPVMYLLAKQLTHRTDISTVAMLLMALDSMHFTQTRIATVDSYAVFFIMLMYLFMFRYRQMTWNHTSLGRTLVPLGLLLLKGPYSS
jgi:dolichyl-phosphate-mannose--protein O-mannosyl transferase